MYSSSPYQYFSYKLNYIILNFSKTFYIKTQIYLYKAKYLPLKVFFNLNNFAHKYKH